jgi:NDP-sugar pyrophosphorylase family protein
MVPASGLSFEAVVLAGGEDKRMYPLTTASMKAFLPVANAPLLSYSLRMLAAAGLKHVFMVCILSWEGDLVLSDWLVWLV